MIIIKAAKPNPFDQNLFRVKAKTAFGGRCLDANETDYGLTVSVYLSDKEVGDDSLLASIVASHSADIVEVQLLSLTLETDKANALATNISAELTYLDTTIAAIDTYTTAQARDVVKRQCQEMRVLLRMLRYLINRII